MDMDEMRNALENLERAIDALEQAGEPALAEKSRDLMRLALTRYANEGGDTTMYDAAVS